MILSIIAGIAAFKQSWSEQEKDSKKFIPTLWSNLDSLHHTCDPDLGMRLGKVQRIDIRRYDLKWSLNLALSICSPADYAMVESFIGKAALGSRRSISGQSKDKPERVKSSKCAKTGQPKLASSLSICHHSGERRLRLDFSQLLISPYEAPRANQQSLQVATSEDMPARKPHSPSPLRRSSWTSPISLP